MNASGIAAAMQLPTLSWVLVIMHCTVLMPPVEACAYAPLTRRLSAIRDIASKEKGAFPEALATDRGVRLGVDREQQSAVFCGLRYPVHNHERMPVRVRKDRAWPKHVPLQGHGIEVGCVVVERSPSIPGLNHVHHPPRECFEGFERILSLCRLLVRSKGAAARRPA